LIAQLLLAGIVAASMRFEFRTFHDAMPVAGSEVCFLPRSFDRDRVEGILAAREIRCLPVQTVLSMPRGSWYFYAQHPAGLVSPHRSELTLSSDAPSDLFKTVRLDLVEAATLDLQPLALGPEEVFFAWGPETAEHQAPVFMRDAGAKTILVPAGVPVIPIISRRGNPVWIGRPVTAPAQRTTVLKREEPDDGTMNLLVAVSYVNRIAEEPPPPPAVRLAIDGEDYPPGTVLGPVRFGGFAVVAFYGVPRKRGGLRLEGAWHAEPVSFEPGSRSHLLVEKPLRAAPVTPPTR
jgi:hypothetical protein